MAVVEPAGVDWRKPGWLVLLLVFAALPLAAVFGDLAIFDYFGNGRYLAEGSTGQHVLVWWESWGRPACVGGAAWLLLMVCRVRPIWSVLLAGGAAAASYVWLVVAIVIVLWHAGPGVLS